MKQTGCDLYNLTITGEIAATLPTAGGGSNAGPSVLMTNDTIAFDIHGTPEANGASQTEVHVPLRSRQPGASEASTTTVVVQAFDARQSDVIQYGDQSRPLDTDGHSVAVMTLAIRGSGDSSELETRTDGTDNALLTPNGGRGGIGVGAIAFDTTQITSPGNYSQPREGDPCHPLASGAHPPAVAMPMAVRRLTPVECARLQGFPDHYLDITFRGKPAADGNKYRALGNSMAVPVMAWIGRRIQEVAA